MISHDLEPTTAPMPDESEAMLLALKAFRRIEEEKLDINYYQAGHFIDYECWVAIDQDLCTIALEPNLAKLIVFLGEGKVWQG